MVEEFRLRGTVISVRHIEEREHQPTRLAAPPVPLCFVRPPPSRPCNDAHLPRLDAARVM